jgi:glucose 1-dehydrogenase
VREFLRRGPRTDVSRALGKIICVSSVHEVIPWAGHANYAASKGGVMMLSRRSPRGEVMLNRPDKGKAARC